MYAFRLRNTLTERKLRWSLGAINLFGHCSWLKFNLPEIWDSFLLVFVSMIVVANENFLGRLLSSKFMGFWTGGELVQTDVLPADVKLNYSYLQNANG